MGGRAGLPRLEAQLLLSPGPGGRQEPRQEVSGCFLDLTVMGAGPLCGQEGAAPGKPHQGEQETGQAPLVCSSGGAGPCGLPSPSAKAWAGTSPQCGDLMPVPICLSGEPPFLLSVPQFPVRDRVMWSSAGRVMGRRLTVRAYS